MFCTYFDNRLRNVSRPTQSAPLRARRARAPLGPGQVPLLLLFHTRYRIYPLDEALSLGLHGGLERLVDLDLDLGLCLLLLGARAAGDALRFGETRADGLQIKRT